MPFFTLKMHPTKYKNCSRLAVQCFKLYWNIKSYTKVTGIKRNLCIHENWLSVAITWNNQCILQIKANKITDLKIQLPDTYFVLVWENLTKWLLVLSIHLRSQIYKLQNEYEKIFKTRKMDKQTHVKKPVYQSNFTHQ